ncbi:MAG: hypothetical protein ACOH1Y_09260 [Propionicimonas sp.]
MSSNLTHRKQLARSLAATSAMTYQLALAQVTRIAAQGLLPVRLDEQGMAAALRVVSSTPVEHPLVGAFIMGGPYDDLVYNGSGSRRATPTCDICQRKLAKYEPWWMVQWVGKGWANDAGVCCGRHRPQDLPPPS